MSQLSLPPASAVLSLIRRRLAGLIVCSRLGSSRNSGWLGNKAAVWPRGEPAAPPSLPLFTMDVTAWHSPGGLQSHLLPLVLAFHILMPWGIISSRGEMGPFGCGDVIHPLCLDEDETHQGSMWCRCDKFRRLFRTGVIRCIRILLPAFASYKSLVKQEEN